MKFQYLIQSIIIYFKKILLYFLKNYANISTVFLSWETIGKLGKNPFFRYFYMWLWLVPILAKFFEKLDSSMTFTLGGNQISISTQLPFSWQLFFFGGLLIALANIIYNLRCPKLTRDFQNIEKYLAELNSDYWLRGYYSDIQKKIGIFDALNKNYLIEDDFFQNEAYKANIFAKAKKIEEYINPIARGFCSIFYYLGFFLLAIVAVHNVAFVWSYIEPHLTSGNFANWLFFYE